MRALLAILLCCAGCDPFAFDDIADSAPIVVMDKPEDYPRGNFGQVIAAVRGQLSGRTISRVAVGGGPDTPVHLFEAWTGQSVNVDNSIDEFCDDATDCNVGHGVAMAGTPRWRMDATCVLITAPPLIKVQVHCSSAGNIFEEVTGPAGTDLEFGASIVALPAGSPLGIALVGAPGTLAGTGQILGMRDGASPQDVVDLGAEAMPAGRLGEVLATGDLGGGDTIFAASQLGLPAPRVIVATQRAGEMVPTIRACLTGGSGFGGALAFGDFDRDGSPELAVGIDRGVATRVETVAIYDGAALAAGAGCADLSPAGMLGCPAGAAGERDVECDGSAFGAALATGDLDADGDDDLFVGAPEATVASEERAGAVFAYASPAGGVAGEVRALVHSTPTEGDELGAPLTVFLGAGDRAEPVAGAPGGDYAAAFLCTGLPDDDGAVGPRCQPRAP